jgi:hypothetical protein
MKLTLVLCHGDFLNADHEYVHKNRNVKGFGSYGDIMIRDRKMYVAPTPFAIAEGTSHQQTLIIPDGVTIPANLQLVGKLTRIEADNLIVGYEFDLRNNQLRAETVANPEAGRAHVFNAWRASGAPSAPVTIRKSAVITPDESDDN